MSRSKRKTPIGGWVGCKSNKKFKVQEHRRERRKVRVELLKDPESISTPHPKEFGNEWASPRDGKMYFGECKYGSPQYYWWRSYCSLEEWVKDQKEEYQRLMRK